MPARARLCVMFAARLPPSWLAVTLVARDVLPDPLRRVEVASSHPLNSSWYLYPEDSFGFAVGFFANANHMGPCSSSRCHFSPRCLFGPRPQHPTYRPGRDHGRGRPGDSGRIVLNRSLAAIPLAFAGVTAEARRCRRGRRKAAFANGRAGRGPADRRLGALSSPDPYGKHSRRGRDVGRVARDDPCHDAGSNPRFPSAAQRKEIADCCQRRGKDRLARPDRRRGLGANASRADRGGLERAERADQAQARGQHRPLAKAASRRHQDQRASSHHRQSEQIAGEGLVQHDPDGSPGPLRP